MSKDQIPADDILKIITAVDDATVVAIHDRAGRRLDVLCTTCGTPITILPARDCTKNDMNRHRTTIAENAVAHADTRHNTPRDATHGSQT